MSQLLGNVIFGDHGETEYHQRVKQKTEFSKKEVRRNNGCMGIVRMELCSRGY